MFTRKRARLPIRESDFHKPTALAATEGLNNSDLEYGFEVIRHIDLADKVIGLGSIVFFTDVGSGITKTVHIVEPHETDAAKLKISASSPLGRVLIGLEPGDHIDWKLSRGMIRTLKIGDVVQTPVKREH